MISSNFKVKTLQKFPQLICLKAVCELISKLQTVWFYVEKFQSYGYLKYNANTKRFHGWFIIALKVTVEFIASDAALRFLIPKMAIL